MSHSIQLHNEDAPTHFIEHSRNLLRRMDVLHCAVHAMATDSQHYVKDGADTAQFAEDLAQLDNKLERIQLFHSIVASPENGQNFAEKSPLASTFELHHVAKFSGKEFDSLQAAFERVLANAADLLEIDQLREDFSTMRAAVIDANAQEHTKLFAEKLANLHQNKSRSAA